ncbi:hypothetical protein BDM02DRAFT_3123073 [Thelephora ganbajun]|uniref:Uncharacterized protein n=1 Tax=Thelephora ganbajun TaxID=370292 RepID=A0ACB6Z2D2_THEGA|nr:hypothetical protein BDM02DRAFT_3123073 [Thelephora ganbajun]
MYGPILVTLSALSGHEQHLKTTDAPELLVVVATPKPPPLPLSYNTALPDPVIRKIGRVSSETAVAP